jgi:hypothetical protein
MIRLLGRERVFVMAITKGSSEFEVSFSESTGSGVTGAGIGGQPDLVLGSGETERNIEDSKVGTTID